MLLLGRDHQDKNISEQCVCVCVYVLKQQKCLKKHDT